jgi:hypothetical protein
VDANFPDLNRPNNHGAGRRATLLRRARCRLEHAGREQRHNRENSSSAHGTLLARIRCVIRSEHWETDNAALSNSPASENGPVGLSRPRSRLKQTGLIHGDWL